MESIAYNPIFDILFGLYVAYPLLAPLHYILGLICITLYKLTKSPSH